MRNARRLRRWWKLWLNDRIRSLRMWHLRSKISYARRFSPDLGELSYADALRMGTLTEHPDWPLFMQYLQTEKWATINNGLIQAKTMAEFGFCQGDVSRINKIESDMYAYHEQLLMDTQQKTEKQQHQAVVNSYTESYDDEDLSQ